MNRREIWLAWDLIGWMNKANTCLYSAQLFFKTIDPETGKIFLKPQIVNPGDEPPIEPPKEMTATELKAAAMAGSASTQRFRDQMQTFLAWLDLEDLRKDALEAGLDAFGVTRTDADGRITELGSIADTAVSQAAISADAYAALIPIGEQIEANNVPWEASLLPIGEGFRIVRVVAIINDLLDFTSWVLRDTHPDSGLSMNHSVDGIKSITRKKCGMISRFYCPNLQGSIPNAETELTEIDIVASKLLVDVQNMADVTEHVLTELEKLGTMQELAALGDYIEQEVPPLDLIRRKWRYS